MRKIVATPRVKRKPRSLLERINRRRSLKKLNIMTRAELNKKYRGHRESARRIITDTQKMLNKFSKDPKLKNAQFVFLDRDALPYMHIAKELAASSGFSKEQFKNGKITHKAEEYFSHYFRTIGVSEKQLISIASNGEEIKEISKRIKKIKEIKNLGKVILKDIDIKKPVVVVDSGYNGTSVKKYQMLLKMLNPNIETYSSMFFASDYAKKYTNYLILDDEKYYKGLKEIEERPKFLGKLLSTKKEKNRITFKRQNQEKPADNYVGGFSSPGDAEIFALAVRNQLKIYKKNNKF